MKPPGWLVMTYVGPSEDRKAVLYDVRVRRWHPGFWWFVLSHIRLRVGR